MKLTREKVEEIIIHSGYYILLVLICNILFCSILFIFNISVSVMHFFMGLLLAAVILKIIYKDAGRKEFITVLIVSALIITGAIFINSLIRDISCDGNLYHKFAVGILSKGWNPLYDNAKIQEYFMQLGIPEERFTRVDIWVPSYPKASWYFGSTVYLLTGNIDAGKAMNGLVLFASGCIIYDYLRCKISPLKAMVTSLMFVAIPAAVAQLFTYYVDGMLGNLLFSIVFLLLSLSDRQYVGNRKRQFLLLAVCIMLIGNLKITGLAYAATFCGIFFIYWCVMLFKDNLAEKWKHIRRLIIYYTGTVLVTVLVIGAGTYITNTVRFGNPFYPANDPSIISFVDESMGYVSLGTATPLRQLMTMLFVRTNADSSYSQLDWKIPFTFHISEFKECSIDAIRGGGGIFFSGIFIVAIIVLVVMMRNFLKSEGKGVRTVLLIIGTSIGLMFIMPAGGMVRYSPYVYLIPYLSIVLLLIFMEKRKDFRPLLLKSFLGIFMGIILINAGAFAKNTVRGILETIKYNNQYREMKGADLVEIDVGLPGVVFNFIDENIAYQYDTAMDIPDGEMRYYELEYKIKMKAE